MANQFDPSTCSRQNSRLRPASAIDSLKWPATDAKLVADELANAPAAIKSVE